LETISEEEINSETILSELKEHLENDGLIIYPTDTLYGIGYNFFSRNAQLKLDSIKKRSDIPYSVVASNFEMINNLTSQSLSQFKLFKKNHSCSKMTFLFKLKNEIDKNLVKGSDLIGIRLPDSKTIRMLVNFFNFPITTTSVNISGSAPLNSSDEIKKMIEQTEFSDDIILINGGKLPLSTGSTIIDFSGKKIKIIRRGDDYEKAKKFINDLRQ